MTKNELVTSDHIRCPKLQKHEWVENWERNVITKPAHALVQNFRDGSTRVLCPKMKQGKCTEEDVDTCCYQVETSD